MRFGEAARADFPLFGAVSGPGGKPIVYLDSASTTQKPRTVLEAMNAFYCTANANPGRGDYVLEEWASKLYGEARAAVARFIGAQAPEQIVFTSGCTDSLNIVARFCAEQVLSEGDRIALPVFEHHSNLLPWQRAARQTGAVLDFMAVGDNGRLPASEIERAIGPSTRVVAIAHVSNVLGLKTDVRAIVEAAHAVGAIVVLDCAQSAGHLPLDVDDLGVDFAAFSGHKTYGPQGIGVLYGTSELLERMEPPLLGGGMVDFADEEESSFLAVPQRLEGGSRYVAGAVGLAQALGYLEGLGRQAACDHERMLALRAIEGLRSFGGVAVYGDASPCADRCGIVSFNVRGIHAYDISRSLGARGVCVRGGNCCAQPLMRHLGITSVCRLSLSCTNTEADVDLFLEALADSVESIGAFVASAVM